MQLLELLAACHEQGRTAIAPTLTDAVERERFEQLRQLGAMTQSRAVAIICPRCEAHCVRVISAGSAFCADCGQVMLTLKDMERLIPDGDWLRRRIAQALDLAGQSAWVIVPGRVWRIGDLGRGNNRHRVLFGQQLVDVRILRALLTVWPTHIGAMPAILITTSSIDHVFLPGVAVQIVPLTIAFHLRGGGLVADEAVWASVRGSAGAEVFHAYHGPFSLDYGAVLLPGDTIPVSLTRTQSAILRVLWEMEGVSIDRERLMQKAGLELEKPVDAFPRNKYPDANRAYRILVSSDGRGRYWMSRNTADSAL